MADSDTSFEVGGGEDTDSSFSSSPVKASHNSRKAGPSSNSVNNRTMPLQQGSSVPSSSASQQQHVKSLPPHFSLPQPQLSNDSFRSPQQLPKHTEVHTQASPIISGLPILEVVVKLEEEKILNRQDRTALQDILYSTDLERRELILQLVQEVELSGHNRFAVRKLKKAIYDNNSGEPTSTQVNQAAQAVVPQTSRADNQSNKLSGPVANTRASFPLSSGDYPSPSNQSLSSKVGKSGKHEKSPKVVVGEEEEEELWHDVQNTVYSVVGVSSHYAGGVHPPALSSNASFGTPQHQPNQGGGMPGTSYSKSSKTSSVFSHGSQASRASQASIQSQSSIASTESQGQNQHKHFNVLLKIATRMDELFTKYGRETVLKQRKLAVLIGSGSYNPLTRMHLRNYFLAKQFLEKHRGYIVLGSLLSPDHPMTVRERYRNNISEILPSPHRLCIAQLLVAGSQWLSVDPWEITRRRAMDYLALCEHAKYILKDTFPDVDIQLIYLSKPNNVPMLSPQAIRNLGCQVITVGRIAETELLYNSLKTGKMGKHWFASDGNLFDKNSAGPLIHIVEDSAILDASLDMVTSRKVREKIKSGENIETLVGNKIQEYVNTHKIGLKMVGKEDWTAEEKQLPKIAARAPEPTLPNAGYSRQNTGLQSIIVAGGIAAGGGSVAGSSSSVATGMTGYSKATSNAYVPSWKNASSNPFMEDLI